MKYEHLELCGRLVRFCNIYQFSSSRFFLLASYVMSTILNLNVFYRFVREISKQPGEENRDDQGHLLVLGKPGLNRKAQVFISRQTN